MKRRTFKKLVALLRPALERDYCKKSVLAVSKTLKIDLYSSTSRAYKIRVCITSATTNGPIQFAWQTGIYSS